MRNHLVFVKSCSLAGYMADSGESPSEGILVRMESRFPSCRDTGQTSERAGSGTGLFREKPLTQERCKMSYLFRAYTTRGFHLP